MLVVKPNHSKQRIDKAVAVISIAAAAACWLSHITTTSNALLRDPSSSRPKHAVERIRLLGGDDESSSTSSSSSSSSIVSRVLEMAEGDAKTIDSGARIWESGRALSHWMAKTENLEPGRRILELGAGTGIVGLAAAAAGAKNVVLTDQPDMVSLLEQNIATNNLRTTARAAALSWGCERDELVEALKEACDSDDDGPSATSSAQSQLQPSPMIFDVVCGSDILYSPENFPLLLETLCEVCTPSATEVVLAYPRRFTEDLFFDTASDYFEISSEEEIEPNVFLSRMRLATKTTTSRNNLWNRC